MPIKRDDLKAQYGKFLSEQCVAIRDRRRLVEERWLRSRRTWMNWELDSRFRTSESGGGSYSVPAGRRAAERSIVRCIKMLTPNVKWHEILPLNDVSQENLTNTDKFMTLVTRKKIKTRTNIGMLARSMLIFGMCGIKTFPRIVNSQVWPSQRVLDPFSFYMYPETVSDVSEAEIIFEDFLFSYERYRTYVERGILDDVGISELGKPDWPYHLVERLAYQGITDPTANIELVIEKVGDEILRTHQGFASLSEIWKIHEDKLYQFYILWNHSRGVRCVGAIESEYTEPTFRISMHRPLPGETYTNSMLEDINELHTLQNDQLNKFQEAVDWEQGFIAALGQRHDSWKAKGRAIWEFADDPRQALQFIQPPITSTNQLRAWQIYLALINSMGGAGTIAEGQPGRNMPRAGFAMNALLEMGLADVQDVAELIEQEVLSPSLGDIHKVSSSFIPTNQLMLIPGGEALYGGRKSLSLRKKNISGEFDFEWVGALQFQDENMRSQRLLIFLNLLSQPTIAQGLAQQKYAVNLVELIRTIWRYGLGERGLADVLVPIDEFQQVVEEDVLENSSSANGSRQGVSGLMYSLPSITNGFVQQ